MRPRLDRWVVDAHMSAQQPFLDADIGTAKCCAARRSRSNSVNKPGTGGCKQHPPNELHSSSWRSRVNGPCTPSYHPSGGNPTDATSERRGADLQDNLLHIEETCYPRRLTDGDLTTLQTTTLANTPATIPNTPPTAPPPSFKHGGPPRSAPKGWPRLRSPRRAPSSPLLNRASCRQIKPSPAPPEAGASLAPRRTSSWAP